MRLSLPARPLPLIKTAIVATALAGGAIAAPLGLASGAPAVSKPAAGTIHVYLTDNKVSEKIPSSVLITGAFSDHGTNSNEGPENAPTAVLRLTKGTITVNIAAINKVTNSPTFGTFHPQSCSFMGSTTGPVKLQSGTGAYAGIKGTIQITLTEAGQLPLLASGACNGGNNVQPVAQVFIVNGVGRASF